MTSGTLLLTRTEVSSLLGVDEYVPLVENAFRLHATGKSLRPSLMHIDSVDGEFHVKAGGLRLDKTYFAVKVGAGFFQNVARSGIPNVLGAILLCSGENGYPLAIMDSGEITRNRTAAATCVAAKYLARPDSQVACIAGCGTQGRAQLRALTHTLPIKQAYAFSRDMTKAELFAHDMAQELGINILPTVELEGAARDCDVCVTCTPSRQYFLAKDYISPGTFIAAVGADSPDKQELDPELLIANKVVADLLEQCISVGEIHHALNSGMRKEDVHAELGEIVTGEKRGRTSTEEIIIFDSTGTALQDVAAAAATYEMALRQDKGKMFNLFR
jgi:alanine dehydrogenase